jgi:hypothetical protein
VSAELTEELLEPMTDEEAADDGAEHCDSERHTWNLPMLANA